MIFETIVDVNMQIRSLKIAPNLGKLDEIKWYTNITAQTSEKKKYLQLHVSMISFWNRIYLFLLIIQLYLEFSLLKCSFTLN